MGQQDIGSGPKGPSIPIVKFRSIGHCIIGALVDEEQRQQQKWVNGKAEGLKFKDNGKPALELVLTLVAMPGTTAVKTDRETGEYVPIQPGEVVRHIVNGFKWGQYIEARNALGRDNRARTGDLIAQTYVRSSVDDGRGGRTVLTTQEQINEAKLADKVVGKDMELVVQRPGPQHAQLVEECNARRATLAQQAIGDERGPFDGDDDERPAVVQHAPGADVFDGPRQQVTAGAPAAPSASSALFG